jgi:hypothetical protein
VSDTPLRTEDVPDPYIYKQFKLLTNGADEELDTLHIIVEAMGSLHGDQIRRILAYLSERYGKRG